MKKFSSIDENFENKKYQSTLKNDIYHILKNSKLSINENLKGDMEFEISKLVDAIDQYVDRQVVNEKVSVLTFIKNNVSTGTLNLQKINEEIESCTCSETCPDYDSGTSRKEYEIDDEFENDFDESTNDKTEFISTNESMISLEEDVDLADEFIKLVDEGKATNMTWESFFEMNNVPKELRTNLAVTSIMDDVKEKRSDIF